MYCKTIVAAIIATICCLFVTATIELPTLSDLAVSGSGQSGSGIVLFTKGYLRIDLYNATQAWTSASLIAIGTCTFFNYLGAVPTYISYPKLTQYPDGHMVFNRELYTQANCSKHSLNSTTYKLQGSTTYTNSYGAYTLNVSHVISYAKATAFIPSTSPGAVIK